METRNNQNEINVGVDTGKLQLDIHILPDDIYFSCSNSNEGIKEALIRIKKLKPTRIVIEATGRLEQAFITACAKAKLPIAIVNPILVKRFAGAIGQLAKTDKLDAKLIAQYGATIRPPLSKLKPETLTKISDLLARRKQLLNMQTMEKNRLGIMPKTLASSIKAMLTVLKRQIEKMDASLEKLIEQCPQQRTKNEIIQSMPGVGKVVALSLISNMPELGYLTNKEASALVGVAPINRESGSFKGKRQVRGGRQQIRTAMYMAMMSAIQCNPVFKAKYNQLLEKGKPKKLAIIACVRKMIVILNSMVRDGVFWDPKVAKQQ